MAVLSQPLVRLGYDTPGDLQLSGQDSSRGQLAAEREPAIRYCQPDLGCEPTGPAALRRIGDVELKEIRSSTYGLIILRLNGPVNRTILTLGSK